MMKTLVLAALLIASVLGKFLLKYSVYEPLIKIQFQILGSRDPPTVPEAKWEVMESGGLRAKVPDVNGMNQVHLHFNINKELPGVAAGDYNIMIE